MDANTGAAVVSAVAAGVAGVMAIVAVVFSYKTLKPANLTAEAATKQADSATKQAESAREQVEAAVEQIRMQRHLIRQAAQPYVWVDIQADGHQGTVLDLVVGNAGPTVARNVRASIEPPFPEHPVYAGQTKMAQERLKKGILSLAPGRQIRWPLGRGFDLLEDEEDDTIYTFTMTADGPYGPLDSVEFAVRPRDWAEARDSPDGSLHLVRKAIQDVAREIKNSKK